MLQTVRDSTYWMTEEIKSVGDTTSDILFHVHTVNINNKMYLVRYQTNIIAISNVSFVNMKVSVKGILKIFKCKIEIKYI